jgi:hypothetical protein
MERRHDLDGLARALVEAARNLRTAKAENVEDVNAILQKLGEDLLRAAEGIRLA